MYEGFYGKGRRGNQRGSVIAVECDQEIIEIAKQYLDVLRQNHVSFESAWLFGSAVNGRADQDSDIDIGLFMLNVESKFLKEVELTRYRRTIDTRIEPHVILTGSPPSLFAQEITTHGLQIA